MEAFFEYFNIVTSSGFLQELVQGFSSVMGWLFTTVTIFGTEYSVISLVFGNGLVIYFGYTLIKHFIPL